MHSVASHVSAEPQLIAPQAEAGTAEISRIRGMLIKSCLSIFLLFHLAVMLLVPNGDNRVGAASAPFMEPYVEFFEFSEHWSFFAPDPGEPVYIQWELVNKIGATIGQGMFPDAKGPYLFGERQDRRLLAAVFMIFDDSKLVKIMVPYLCASNPQVDSVSLWKIVDSPISMEDAASGKRVLGDSSHRDRRFVSHSFCEDKK